MQAWIAATARAARLDIWRGIPPLHGWPAAHLAGGHSAAFGTLFRWDAGIVGSALRIIISALPTHFRRAAFSSGLSRACICSTLVSSSVGTVGATLSVRASMRYT